MVTRTQTSAHLPERLTPLAWRALDQFGQAALAAYGDGLVNLVLFGSRSRGEARSDSDVDVAVVLRELRDRRADRDRMADLAYDAIIETGVDIHTVPVSLDEWEHPGHHANPALIRAIKRRRRHRVSAKMSERLNTASHSITAERRTIDTDPVSKAVILDSNQGSSPDAYPVFEGKGSDRPCPRFHVRRSVCVATQITCRQLSKACPRR